MAGKSRLGAFLTGDRRRLAELALEKGDLRKAAEHYAHAGDFSSALKLTCQAGNEDRAIIYAFKAALGADSGVPAGTTTQQAGELLKASGLLKQAMALFELATAYGAAGEVATKLKQPIRAAELYEKAGDWGRAAIYFESEERWADAVRMLGLQSRALEKQFDQRRDPEAVRLKREIDDRRATLLAKLGRHDEAVEVVAGQDATPLSAELLEQSGRALDAFEGYLEMGNSESAYHVLRRMTDLSPPDKARLLRRCGRAREAAAELSSAGLHAQAARILEEEGLWREAGTIWELANDFLAAGSALRKAGDYDAAAHFFQKGEKPALAADALTRIGRHSDAVTCYLKAGETRQAAEAYQRNHQQMEAATYFLQVGDRQRAIGALEQVRAGSERFYSACARATALLIEDGNAEQALTRVRKIPNDPRAVGDAALDRLYWEGRALEALNRAPEAASCYRALAAVAPEHEDVQARLDGRPALPPPAATDFASGQEIAARYRIEKEIGRGGMSRVYQARDLELEETIALKVVLDPNREGSPEEARLIREVQICRRIAHPNIVRMYDLGRFDGGLFISMELLEGENLAHRIANQPPLTLARCRAILSDVLAGLREAHAQSVVHRDLKPHKIFLTAERAKILDFGIARGRRFDASLPLTCLALGTPHYMAPEQLRGHEVTERTDLYALGVVTYEMLTGRPPFDGDSPAAVALAHVETLPPDIRALRPDLPEAWAQFVHRLLAKEPELRLPTSARTLNVAHALPLS